MSSSKQPEFPSRRDILVGSTSLLFQAPSPFGGLIARLSDPETGPAADNLISNEDSYPRVTSELASTVPPDSVYIGVGPDQNLTYCAHARPRLAFIVDYRRRNSLLHLFHKALFSLANDRTGYLSLLTARKLYRTLPNNPSPQQLVAAFSEAEFDKRRLEAATLQVAEILRPLGVLKDEDRTALATIHAKLAGPGMSARFLALAMYPTFAKLISTTSSDGQPAHFLATDALYATIRDKQRADALIPLVGDLAGKGCMTRIANYLRETGMEVGCLYISDVEFFLLRSRTFPAYLANLERLPWARRAIIIRTSTREIAHAERVKRDSATTIIRPVATFLRQARENRFRTVDDLFGLE